MNSVISPPPIRGLNLQSAPASATRIRQAACEYAGEVGADVEDVAIAVGEAAANAVIHGYRGPRPGLLELRMRVSERALAVTVRDWGHGMAPNPRGRGLGMGLSLIAAVCEEFRVESPPGGGTLALMRLGLPEAG